jgi:HSP20 family molecular chaperone IbpA
MYVTIDVSRQEGLKQSELELNLSDGGTVVQLMKKTQLRPFRRFDLPQKASKIVEWSLNNGILDITFELGNE